MEGDWEGNHEDSELDLLSKSCPRNKLNFGLEQYKIKFAEWCLHNLERTEFDIAVRMLIVMQTSFATLEFDPGSGRTLAACLKHASRTRDIVSTKVIWIVEAFEKSEKIFLPAPAREEDKEREVTFVLMINLVADGWVTREQPAYHRGITVGNDC